jgi:hypothetical protein
VWASYIVERFELDEFVARERRENISLDEEDPPC